MFLCICIIWLNLIKVFLFSDVEVTTIGSKDICRDNNRLITSDKYDRYTLVEIALEETFILECHSCSEYDNNEPKIWYKIEPDTNTAHEIEYGMDNNPTSKRISLSLNHSLVVNEAKISDTGIYYCQSISDEDTDFNFIVDVIFASPHTQRGDIVDWTFYNADYIRPVNKLFISSNEFDFQFIRNELKLHLQLDTEWGRWSTCEVCDRPPGMGIQESVGYCRIKIKSLFENSEYLQHENITEKLKYFMNIAQVSCSSYLFQQLFPDISNITGDLPVFLQTRQCDGVCGLDMKGLGWKASKGYKFRKMFVLAEKAHLTVVCPESTLENVVIWRRNGITIKPGRYIISKDNLDEPHVMVDSYGTLYLTDVTTNEEGNYTCQVDDIKMQQVRIVIVSKTTIITRAFLRHMGYLAMALSLTSFCYCSGLFLAWRRRRTFKTYDEVVEEDKNKANRTTLTYESDIRSSELKDNKTDESGVDSKSGKKIRNIKGRKKLYMSVNNDTDDQISLLKEHDNKDNNITKEEAKISIASSTESEDDKRKSELTERQKEKITKKKKVELNMTTDSQISDEKQLLTQNKNKRISKSKKQRNQELVGSSTSREKSQWNKSDTSDEEQILLPQRKESKIPKFKKKVIKSSTSGETTEWSKSDTSDEEQILLPQHKQSKTAKFKTESNKKIIKSSTSGETTKWSKTSEDEQLLLIKKKKEEIKTKRKEQSKTVPKINIEKASDRDKLLLLSNKKKTGSPKIKEKTVSSDSKSKKSGSSDTKSKNNKDNHKK